MEIGEREVMVPFSSVLPSDDEQPAPPIQAKKIRNVASAKQTFRTVTASNTQLPASSRQDSTILPQLVLVVCLDGLEINCGDLVTVSPSCTDPAFLLIAIYRRDSREMLKALKCLITEGVVAGLPFIVLSCYISPQARAPESSSLDEDLPGGTQEGHCALCRLAAAVH